MCFWPPVTVRAVVWELRKRIDEGDVFTAYDVSRAVKESGVETRHSDVRRLVHALYEEGYFAGVYNRTLGSVGEGATAFLYHPANVLPSLYSLGKHTIEILLSQNSGSAPE